MAKYRYTKAQVRDWARYSRAFSLPYYTWRELFIGNPLRVWAFYVRSW